MIIAAAALMAVGCEKNIEMVSEDDVNQDLLSLTIELPTDTKIAFNGNDGYKSSWEEGDVLAVQTSEPTGDSPAKYALYELKEGAGTKTGTFEGSVTPLQGGKVLYPAKGWDTSYEKGPMYHFDSEYIWDKDANKENKIHSVVPMVGKVIGTKIKDFDYASGAISITYSKIPLTTAKFVITLSGVMATGFASLDENELAVTAGDGEDNTITVYMNKDKESQLGGTANDVRFFLPVPKGKYTGLTMELIREDGITIGGSHFTMAEGKSFDVSNKELKILPRIEPQFPHFYFSAVETGATLTDGEYILVYDRRPVEGGNKVWINGDDKLREVLPGEIITLNNEMTFIDKSYWGKEGVKLDYADYVTGVWKMSYESSEDKWTVKTPGKGDYGIHVNGWNGEYVNLAFLCSYEWEYSSGTYRYRDHEGQWQRRDMEYGKTYYYWAKYIKYIDHDTLINDKGFDDIEIYANGLFLIPSYEAFSSLLLGDLSESSSPNIDNYVEVQDSNIKMFRLIAQNDE